MTLVNLLILYVMHEHKWYTCMKRDDDPPGPPCNGRGSLKLPIYSHMHAI